MAGFDLAEDLASSFLESASPIDGTLIFVGATVLAVAALARAIVRRVRAPATDAGGGDDRFRAFAQTAADAIVTADASARILFANGAAERIFGHVPGELVGRDIQTLIPQHLHGTLATALRDLESTDRHHLSWDRVEIPGLHREGRLIPLEVSLGQFGAGAGREIFAIVRDISARKEVERALRESEERLALAVAGARDGLWDWNLRTNELHLSSRCLALLGLPEAATASRPDTWFARVAPEDRPAFESDVAAHLRGRTAHLANEHRVIFDDGTTRWLLVRGLAVADPSGRPSRMAGSITDVTDRRDDQERMRHGALHDALTGLPNRTFFLDRLRQALTRARHRHSETPAVAFIDIDGFKVVNDSMGHACGDDLLVQLSRRLEACLRRGDSVARLGGDEFGVLFERGTTRETAEHVAGRLQSDAQRPLRIGDREVSTSLSIGVAFARHAFASPEELMHEADTAMYVAKSRGKAGHVVFEPGMRVPPVGSLRMDAPIRLAAAQQGPSSIGRAEQGAGDSPPGP